MSYSIAGVHRIIPEQRLDVHHALFPVIPTIRKADALSLRSARAPLGLSTTRRGKQMLGSSLPISRSDILKIFTFHERPAGGASNGESLEIPRDMLTQIMHGHLLIAIIELGQQPGMALNTRHTSPSVGLTRLSLPAKAFLISANSHGLPWHPRPIATPAHPVSRTIASASSAPQISPLPNTGMSSAPTSSPMRLQSECPP